MRLILLFICLPLFAIGQCYNRYINEIFTNIQTTTNITYGMNTNDQGDSINLLLDFYEPANDPVQQRPLIILLHGPDLVNGSKDDSDVVNLSEKFAKKGFAVAAINYRNAFSLQTVLDEDQLFAATLRAAQDAKAAVRFFREDLYTNNNYSFDSSMIWLAGIGSGSMAAQMAVYLDDANEVSTDWQTIIQTLDGLEGNSGHPSYSSKVRGVINLSGATINDTWMDGHTEPIINIHSDDDDYYPYGSGRLFAYTHQTICNGHHELCYKRLNEATFVHTHNSHANDGDFSVLAANQDGDVPAQFAAGVRALGLKLYYTSSFFCGSGTKLYAYHGNPVLGCIEFSTIGSQILTFLNNNPNEFLFITVEGSASNNEIRDGFNSAGLSSFLYQHTLGDKWPTIGELIASGQRIIVMTDNAASTALPGYHHMWSFVQDTEYNFQSTNDFNCNYLRGNMNADLFLLNHFLTIASPQPLSANSTNAWDLLLDRARQCGAARNLHPNFLYIDFFDSGDVFRAADSLNRIGDDFPFVHGSSIIHNYATGQGQLSALYTMNGQGFAPYTTNWADSAIHFISNFMIEHYPCSLSCATPVNSIIGQDSIIENIDYTFSITPNQGATYEWTINNTTYTGNQIMVNLSTSMSPVNLTVVETSQYGCVYDTLSTMITVLLNTPIDRVKYAKNAFKVFPNPAHDQLYIHALQGTMEDYDIHIFNQLGQEMLQSKLQGSQTNLDIQTLPKGSYYIHIRGKKTFSSSFIKL